jgi:HSP20 family protein
MTERMRRMLDQTFGGLAWPSPVETGGWSPSVDIEETDDAYVVEADLPGVKAKDVSIELVGNELAITGELKDRERKGALRRQTRRTGRFEYRVTLPDHVDADKIEARLNDGVLTVRAPKSERAQRRKIELES